VSPSVTGCLRAVEGLGAAEACPVLGEDLATPTALRWALRGTLQVVKPFFIGRAVQLDPGLATPVSALEAKM
jgi:hypothetical protein